MAGRWSVREKLRLSGPTFAFVGSRDLLELEHAVWLLEETLGDPGRGEHAHRSPGWSAVQRPAVKKPSISVQWSPCMWVKDDRVDTCAGRRTAAGWRKSLGPRRARSSFPNPTREQVPARGPAGRRHGSRHNRES